MTLQEAIVAGWKVYNTTNLNQQESQCWSDALSYGPVSNWFGVGWADGTKLVAACPETAAWAELNAACAVPPQVAPEQLADVNVQQRDEGGDQMSGANLSGWLQSPVNIPWIKFTLPIWVLVLVYLFFRWIALGNRRPAKSEPVKRALYNFLTIGKKWGP